MNIIEITKNGDWSNYIIVTPQNMDSEFKETIRYLANTIYQVSGVNIGVFEDNVTPTDREICVGLTNRIDASEYLTSDNSYISIDTKILLVADNTNIRGVVVKFIDSFIKSFKTNTSSSENDFTPNGSISVSKGFYTIPQKLKSKLFYGNTGFDEDYNYKNNLDNYGVDIHRGTITFPDTGNSVHSILPLIGYDDLFAEHPEYFAEIGGVRVYGSHINPCLSSEGLYQVVKTKLTTLMAEQPSLDIWDVSQPDGIEGVSGYCSCSLCKPKHDTGNGLSETLFPFINRLAGDFPHKIIRTLAYMITEKPAVSQPTMRSNTEVVFCLTTNDKSKSILNATDISSVSFRDSLNLWKNVGCALMIWDYSLNFSYILFPFPFLATLKDTLHFLKDKNVKRYMVENVGEEWSNFKELHTFVTARLYNDINTNAEAVVNEFCKYFYGTIAGYYVAKYYNTLSINFKNSNDGIWNVMSGTGSLVDKGNPNLDVKNMTTFSLDRIIMYRSLLNSAKSATVSGTIENLRVRREYLCLQSALIEIGTRYANTDSHLYSQSYYDILYEGYNNMTDMFDSFLEEASLLNITYMNGTLRSVSSWIADCRNVIST